MHLLTNLINLIRWKRHIQQLLTILLLSFLLLPFDARSEEQFLVTAGPAWPGFTNRDGSGLYHELIQQIFSDSYTIKHLYVSSDQANDLVALGRADIKLCEPGVEPPLQLGKYPMYENAFYAVFHKTKLAGWRGVESLTGHRVAWREGYYSKSDFPVEIIPQPVRSGTSALMMLSLERVDFYVDDLILIKESFSAASGELNPLEFSYQQVGSRQYFPVFSTTQQGEKLRKIYEEGIERLYHNNALQPIYQRWNFPIPQLAIP